MIRIRKQQRSAIRSSTIETFADQAWPALNQSTRTESANRERFTQIVGELFDCISQWDIPKRKGVALLAEIVLRHSTASTNAKQAIPHWAIQILESNRTPNDKITALVWEFTQRENEQWLSTKQ